jgi:hypothetical protein
MVRGGMKIHYNDANATVRNFAWAAACCQGYNPCDQVFWSMFNTKPIPDNLWLGGLRSMYEDVIRGQFPDLMIEIPDDFLHWLWSPLGFWHRVDGPQRL